MRKNLLAFLMLSLLAACTSPPKGSVINTNPWAGVLRALDPVDTTIPAHDLTAVYLRQGEDDLQIRVDLLDFQDAHDLALDLKIRDDASPGATPLFIHIPSEDDSTRVQLDPLLATVIVEVPWSAVTSRPRVDVSTPEDEITGLTLDDPVPTQAAPLLLTFYDTFAARFPAEALRSWDGAHTGPRGERHGLKHLLQAAVEYRTPIVLLDLKKPENLSALDAMGALPQIQRLEQDGLLILPDQSGQAALFGFSPSHFTWGRMLSRPTFVSSSDPNHIYHPLFSKTIFIPIAIETDSTQPAPDGPSLEVRRALLEVALNADETDLLVLGDSVRGSTWGSPDMAGATLAYFASRPYIHILTADDLMGFSTKIGKPEIHAVPQNESLNQLQTHYENLSGPVLDFAANWKGSPHSSCASDIDQDGQPECVLANQQYLAFFEPQGARLTYLFAVGRVSNAPYIQLVGPSWQVAVGLSNPAQWDLSAGEAADPGAYPGAFTDADDPFKSYEPVVDGNTLVFTSLDGTRVKTFELTETGLKVTYETQEPVIAQIPLLVEPEARFTPGWAQKYVQEKTPGGIAWGLENGPMVSVQTEAPIKMRAFNESLSLLSSPEDPDFDYPPGHYIPFPIAIAEVEMQNGYFLRLERLP